MSKSQTVWTNSNKSIDSWSVYSRNRTTWNNESNFPGSYIYSDPNLTYNSSTRPYNYISAVPKDQVNNKNPTAWMSNMENNTTWSNESVPQIGYTFDSTATYDSTYTFDYTIMVANQSNSKNATAWMVVV